MKIKIGSMLGIHCHENESKLDIVQYNKTIGQILTRVAVIFSVALLVFAVVLGFPPSLLIAAPIMIGWMVLNLWLVLYLIEKRAKGKIRQLVSHGESVEAEVTRKKSVRGHRSNGANSTSYLMGLKYTITSSGMSITGLGGVTPESYRRLKEGAKVRVRVVPHDPHLLMLESELRKFQMDHKPVKKRRAVVG